VCGITGAFSIGGRTDVPLEPSVLARMTEVIRYRGPDDAGYVAGHGMALGARRLSIIDVAGGHQPLASEDRRVWGAQNGEIYNHAELRADLERRGHRFGSSCDTEVLPHLYEEYGAGLVNRLHGKFAIAVWDSAARRGVLARDRVGIKPLYYAIVGDLIVFGSELKCVTASGLVSPELDPGAIAAYLMLGFVPGPMSPLKDVKKLMPGERLMIGNGEVRHERYWRYPKPKPDASLSSREWAERVRGELDEAVRKRLMSDVPLGAMLSGGLDSSLIVALMKRHLDAPVKTFAVGFTGTGLGSELGDAQRMADALGAEHHGLELPLETGEAALDRLTWHLDEPVRSLSSLGFLALSDLAAEHVTVALSGQGADELFAGYLKHRVASLTESWRRVPAALRRPVAAAGARYAPGDFRRLAVALQAPDPAARLIASSGLLRPDLRKGAFAGALAEYEDAALRAASAYANEVPGAGPLGALLYLDGQLGLVDDMIHYFDRTSMAVSLEVRVPFLDHKLVETAALVPDALKVRGRETKYVLREAARGLLPDFVFSKPKLGFFEASVEPWLKGGGRELIERKLTAPDAPYRDVVDATFVEQSLAAWRGGASDRAQFVLAMLLLENWLSSYLPRAFAPPSVGSIQVERPAGTVSAAA
jgi:asparagine synthase (glutamine-hydrolysing)